jgi:hypothetical protein
MRFPSKSLTLAMVATLAAFMWFGFWIQKTPVSCFSTPSASYLPVSLQHDFYVDFKRKVIRTSEGNTPFTMTSGVLSWSMQGKPPSGIGRTFTEGEIDLQNNTFRIIYQSEVPGQLPSTIVTSGTCRPVRVE